MVAFGAISMPAHAEWVGDVRAMMGTEVRVLLWDDDPAEAERLIEEVFDETARIDELMSTYIENSRISDINRRAADEPARMP